MSATKDFTMRLLRRAHSPASAQRIFADKIRHRPQLLTPTDGDPKARQDARARRRARRERLTQAKRRKPRPLSAKARRELGVHLIPEEERKYALYVGLHKLWCEYMREILHVPALKPRDKAQAEGDVRSEPTEAERQKYHTAVRQFHVEPATSGPKLLSADFHGAKCTVVRSRCVSRVGLQGIIVKDTKFTFEIITIKDELKRVPKEHTVFSIEVPLFDIEDLDDESKVALKDVKSLVFELNGAQFQNRAPDRASKKIKTHIPTDL